MIKPYFIQRGLEYNYFILYSPPPQHFRITGVYYDNDFAGRITGWSRANLVTQKQLEDEYGEANINEGIKYIPDEIRRKFIIMAFKERRKI